MIEAAHKIFGKDLDAIDRYVVAKHGLERNEYFARSRADEAVAELKTRAFQKTQSLEFEGGDFQTKEMAIDELWHDTV